MRALDVLHLAELTNAAEPMADLPSPDRLRELREAAGVPLTTAAAIVGVGVATVSRWERGLAAPTGLTRRPYLKLLTALASLDG